MDEQAHGFPVQTDSALRPLSSVVFSIITIVLGFAVIGQLTGLFIGFLFYDGSFTEWSKEFSGNLRIREQLREPLLWLQGTSTAVGLALMPWLYLRFVEKTSPQKLFRKTNGLHAVLAVVIVLLGMVPNSVLIEWNSNLTFPGDWDTIIREREQMATVLTRFLTTFRSPVDFLVGLVVIAVLPALGEEIAFRGMLQPALIRFTNVHVGIWVTAILFSAFHFQFLGFVPRVMLGALFGYLAAWSGNLWLPVIAHFTNNAFSGLMIYLHQLGISGLDPETTDSAPWSMVVPSVILLVMALAYSKRRMKTQSYPSDDAALQ